MEASEGRETERTATTLLKSAVQSAAKSLTYFIQQKDFHLSHVEDSARTLRNKLNALLKDVDGMRWYNESVQLIEVANNIKNVIDSFISKIAERRGETSAGWMSYQSTFNSGNKDKPAIEDLGKEISDLKRRLDEILSNRSQYGIHNIQASGEASTSSTQSQIQMVKRAPNLKRRRDEIILPNRSQYGIHKIQPCGEASTSSNQSQMQREKRVPIVNEAEVVGFEDETRKLVGRLIAGDKRLVVISITGIGGTGITILAKKVYDDIYVRKSFDIRFWVNVPQEYQVRDILLACIITFLPWLSRGSMESMSEEDMRRKLSGYLERKRYLVVIDGIWSREAWDGMGTAFPDWENGSRVLLTTRNEEVAKYAHTQSANYMLSQEEVTAITTLKVQNKFKDETFGPLHVNRKSLESLLYPMEWVDDEVISKYGELLAIRENKGGHNLLKCHFFNAWFHTFVCTPRKEDQKFEEIYDDGNDEQIKRIIRQIPYKLESKEKLMIPLHEMSHWYLLVIDLKRKIFSIYNSLKGHQTSTYINMMVSRLKIHLLKNSKIDCAGFTVSIDQECPQQPNSFDCGVYLMKFMECLSRGDIFDFKSVMYIYIFLRHNLRNILTNHFHYQGPMNFEREKLVAQLMLGKMITPQNEIYEMPFLVEEGYFSNIEVYEGRETERMAESAVQSAAETLTQKDFYLSHVDECVTTLRNKLKALPNRSQYGIQNIQAHGEASTSSNQSQIQREKRAPIVEEAEVVGFEDETGTLVERLITGDMRRVVISITGTGGIGKTTLAKKIYDNIQVRKSFGVHRWVNVHQQYRVREILFACIQTFDPWLSRGLMERMSEEVLQTQLSGYLKRRRYLVVIDGIWSKEAWDGLVTAFPDCKIGSRVLLTTRNEELAKYADRQSTPHKLRFLNENESWTLFCKKALLGNPSPACLPNLEELGRRMVAKCGGLPLAITVLGGVLSTKEKSVNEWEKMLRRVEWWLDESEEDAISGTFALSYDDLPYYLKPCFLYFGAFPENLKISVGKLIRIWIAEGFVQRRGEKEMEDVAEDRVEELISRSMILVSERKSNGMVKTCRITNHLRDLAISKAEDERFLYVYANKAPTSSIMAERLAITSGDISNCISLNSSTPHLLSLLDFSDESDLPEKLALEIQGGAFKFLRVMHLQSKKVNYLPDKIGDLIHLRYLRLEIGMLELLPSTITGLCNLQTLDIRRNSIEDKWLADDIVNIEQRHLMVYEIGFSNGMQLHHLSNLRTLKRVRADSWIEDGLEKLTNLRDLGIDGIRGEVYEALSSSISKLVHLRSLLLWARYPWWIPAFDFSKHEHLYKMKLYGSLYELSGPHVFPPNLTELYLGGSKLGRNQMVTLEKLPNLKSLYIFSYLRENAYMGKEMVCSATGFPLLDTLTISGFFELEEWRVEEGAMRNLKCLEISNCKRLKMLPDGLRYLITLQELKFWYMSEEMKERVRENEGEDWYKIRHIPSLIIE